MLRFLLAVLLFAVLLFAVPTHPGRAADPAGLRIATWNVEWFTTRPAGSPGLPADAAPKRPEDIATLAAYAARLDPAVVALEEVDGPDMAAKLFPPDRYRILVTGDQVVQRVALAIRRDIPVTQHLDLATLDVSDTAYHLRSGLDATVTLAGHQVRVLAVHLKSGCWEAPLDDPKPACRQLDEQLPVLSNWIDDRVREHEPFIVLGDFNRRFLPGDPFLAALRAVTPLASATENHSSPCWGGEEFIDQILAGGAARDWMRPDTLRVMVFHETGEAMKERLSDHCPVSVRFDPTP